MTNELLVVTAGRHARLEAVLKTALQGVPFRRYDMAGGALPDLRQRRVLLPLLWTRQALTRKSAAC